MIQSALADSKSASHVALLQDVEVMQKRREVSKMDPSQVLKQDKYIHSMLQFSAWSINHCFVFKSKSERETFTRLVRRIYSLHIQSKDEVIYTY